ncbi:hypothetical protein GGQ74_000673 [Desulfobaculum xiamenense]|uniref:Uncharacterized protein n=1 Tax=Desulfobaculum xiamenense TaxID=995050 RepID=A0A846QLH0_9BACT|nr:hypothetical protein [Desulfobaculum xiamenense]NJB67033.1 hypothetical protein [Desulfobaculum xiamenense]
MDWYRITLSLQDIAQGGTSRLQDRFIRAWTQHDAPREMRMYALREKSRPATVFYFSPGCGEVILKHFLDYNPSACPSPEDEDLMLLVGHGEERKG